MQRLLKILAIALPPLLIVSWLAFWPLMNRIMERQSSAAEIRLTHVRGNVYLVDAELKGRQLGASLAAAVGPNGVLLVDTPMTTVLSEKVGRALADLGAGEVRYVVNTHPHPDHVRGNAFFARTATILAHAQTRLRMAEKVRPFRWLPAVPPMPSEALPSETFTATRTLQFNGEEVRLIHFGAGHTDGDVVVYFTASNVAAVGDLFNGRGGHSVSDLRNAGGDVEGLAQSLDELTRILPPDVLVLCGHGGLGQVSRWSDLDSYRQMLTEVLARVKTRRAAGESLKQVSRQGVPPQWRSWFESARGDSVMHGSAEGWLKNLFHGLDRVTD